MTKHYTDKSIEPIDAIESWELNYNLGNVVKYLARYKDKGEPAQDLAKALNYLHREVTGRWYGE